MGNYSFVPGKISSPILSMSKNYVTKEMLNVVLDKVKNIVRGLKLCFRRAKSFIYINYIVKKA